eukprot:g3742.t1
MASSARRTACWLLFATAAAGDNYTKVSGANCYSGHGGEEIDVQPATGLSVSQCEARCDADDACACVTYWPAQKQCWMRAACVASEFLPQADMDVYVRGDLPPTPAPPAPEATVNLMTAAALGAFADEGWEGYACTFAQWTACVNGTAASECASLGASSPCRACRARRGSGNGTINCEVSGGQTIFRFPAGGVFPVTQQFALPPNTAIIGAANPTDPADKARQQTAVGSHTWFVVPRSAALCGSDPMCSDATARGPTACSGDPHTHRQGFLMASNTLLQDLSFQGADLGRAGSEGTLCGPGAIELPGCLSGNGCRDWAGADSNGRGVVRDVTVRNVRLSDAVLRADVRQMGGDCATGEALDSAGGHVPAHQVSVWVAKLPDSEAGAHENVTVDNLVSMNSRADGFNVHGAVHGLVLRDSHLENSGDDCIGVWSTGILGMAVRNVTARNCAVTAGRQSNWGSCMGTYAFQSLSVDGLRCFDPFASTAGCNDRTHYSAIHLNKAFAKDCMPRGATLRLAAVEYALAAAPGAPLARAKCAQCAPCCGQCSAAGFNQLQIEYADGSVPAGSCKQVHSGPGC